MENLFEIGDRVICVDDRRNHPQTVFDFRQWVVREKEYHVRGFQGNDGIVTGILLEEVHNPPIFIKLLGRKQEPAFAVWRFRKTKSAFLIAEEKEEECVPIEELPPGELNPGKFTIDLRPAAQNV
jgi:hypothetical protein